jgi:hypothetical protein
MSRATSKSRGLSARQVRELLAENPSPDPKVAGLAFAKAYRFADGRALVVLEDGKGRLHESRTALLAMLGEVDAQTPVSPFGALLPQGTDFPGPALAAEVGLPIPDGVRELDDVVRRIGPAKCLRPPVFAQLVAYAGETIIAVRGGAWETRLASDGTAWEPWVIDGERREHAPFGVVYKELAEWGRGSSLSGALSASLTPLRG